MEAHEKEIINELLKAHTGATDAELAEIYDGEKLKPDAKKFMFDRFDSKVNELKTLATSKFDEGHKKAKGEVLAQLEREILEDSKDWYKHEAGKTGKELIKDMLEKRGATKKEIKDFKDTQEYKDLVAALDAERAEKTKILTERESEKKAIEFEKTFSKVLAKAYTELESKFAYYGETPTQIEFNKRLFERSLKEAVHGWQIDATGEIIPLGEDGTVLRDSRHTPVKFSDLVDNNSLHIIRDKQRAKKGGDTGKADDGKDNKDLYNAKYPVPKDEAEALRLREEYDKKGNKEGSSAVWSNWKIKREQSK